jgi:transposase
MVRRRISEAQRWQIIGMHTTGMSFKAIGRQMGYHYTVISRLVRKHTQTNNVKDLPRSGRPRVTSDRDDRALQRLVRRMPFATSPVLKRHRLPNRRLSTRTVRNRLKSAGLKSRRVNKRPLLVDRHWRTRLAWCLARRGWNLRTWRKIHWSDERRFLLHVTDGRTRVWRHKNTAYTPRNIQPTVPYGGGPVTVWGCISHDCRLDLVTIQGNPTGDQYIRDVLQPTSCCPPFRQPPTSYKACIYGWQHQASSFKSSNRLPPKRSRDFCSLASHEPRFESHRAYLGHVRPSYTGSGTSCAKHSSVGSSIASGMAAAITTGHPTSNWRDETQGWGRHPGTWGYTRYWTLNNRCRQVIHKWRFESEMTILSCFLNCEGQYLKWTCFTAKTGLVILWF